MPGARRSLCVFNDNVVTYIPSFCVHNRIEMLFFSGEGGGAGKTMELKHLSVHER